jgi:thiol-disulfide isomerase/thioredoxin
MKTKNIILFVSVVAVVLIAGFYVDSQMKESRGNLNNAGSNDTSEKISLGDYGKAPDFAGIDHWLNSDPLTIGNLRGKVVLIDFWTYSCINCIRTLPYVTKWYDTYSKDGLVVVGVHTPEFAFEKETSNVADAIKRFGINYPVAQDNEYGTWKAYDNQYWPAEYLIDKEGKIVYTHFGEGNYDHTENAIRQLLGLNYDAGAKTSNLGNIQSPEMYFGLNHNPQEYLTPDQDPSLSPHDYHLPSSLSRNNFALEGTWQFDGEKSTLTEGPGKIKLHFSSGKVFIVASSDKPITLKIMVDGKSQPDVIVNNSQLYTLFDSEDYSDHVIEITISTPGFKAFSFTFG